ncbi:MAG TPA: hypothetical protein VEZ47_12990, partial [Gemmatirosa sp.]|nr:hypothetical protein [Gemmatirosa sp.]
AGGAGPAGAPDAHPQGLAEMAEEWAEAVERALQLPELPDSRWHRAGISPRAERWLEVVSSVVIGVLAAAWLWSIVTMRDADRRTTANGEVALGATPATRAVSNALTRADAPTAAYLADAALETLTPLRGVSGKLRVAQRTPDEPLPAAPKALPSGAAVTYVPRDSAAPGLAPPTRPGIVGLAVRVGGALRPVADLDVITLTPLGERRGGRIGRYFVGRWPTEGGRGPVPAAGSRAAYAAPRGLIEATRANQDTRLSEHFRIRDFLTHDQANVWPKYVVVQPRLLDKLELVLADLAARGIPTRGVHVMSGFRTPQYNAGGGQTAGRAGLSRHMYGDAADLWIDNDGDGRMDDLNGDRRVDIRDAEVIRAAVDRVERAHPSLAGGCGVYPATSAHGPFTHIDARGYQARWLGSGDGG